MLTFDLVRVKKSKGLVIPRYVKESKKLLEKASRLISIYKEYVGETRGELEEAIKDLIGDGTDYLLQRGFAKLLSDRSTFEMRASIEPSLVRQKLFEKTVPHHPIAVNPDLHHTVERHHIISDVAEELNLTIEEIEQTLYADLQDAYILEEFEDIEPVELLNRYNVALAQAVLFRASKMDIFLHNADAKRLRQLIRFVKFFRLISDIRPTDRGYHFVLDGPLSLFRFSQKYGLQMAKFLPALLLCEEWELEANLLWDEKKTRYHFRLDSNELLKSYYPDKGVYVTDEEKYFRKRWKSFKLDWSLQSKMKIIRLGTKDIIVTDYKVSHEDGRSVLLEILGFWHRDSLIRRLELLDEFNSEKIILVAPSRLRVSEQELAKYGSIVYFFKDVIQPKRIVEFAEKLTT